MLLYVVNIDIDLTDVKRDDGKREYSIVTGCYFNQFSFITDTVFDICSINSCNSTLIILDCAG